MDHEQLWVGCASKKWVCLSPYGGCREEADRIWRDRMVSSRQRHQTKCVFSPCLFNLNAELIYFMKNWARSEEGEVKIRRNTSYLRYEDDVLNWQCSEMTSNESEAESVKTGLQLNTKKTKPWPQKKYTTLTQTTKTFKLLMILLTLAQSSIQMETAAKKCQPFQRRLKLERRAMGKLGRDH